MPNDGVSDEAGCGTDGGDLREPRLVAHKSTFEPAVHAKLQELRRLWDRLIPENRRRELAETFTLAWRGRTSQLIVRLKEDGDGACDE